LLNNVLKVEYLSRALNPLFYCKCAWWYTERNEGVFSFASTSPVWSHFSRGDPEANYGGMGTRFREPATDIGRGRDPEVNYGGIGTRFGEPATDIGRRRVNSFHMTVVWDGVREASSCKRS